MTNTRPVCFTRSLDVAMSLLQQPGHCIISRLPAKDLLARAKRVTAAACDYDGTLIAGSQWVAVDQLVPTVFHAQMNASRTWFFSHRDTGTNGMTIDNPDWFHAVIETSNDPIAEAAWVAETFQIYRDARIHRDQLHQVGTHLIPREGAIHLLELMKHRVVISMGIEQVIESWLRHHAIISPIAASRLLFEDGLVSGYHFNLVVGHTKRTAADRFRKMTNVQETDLLVLGDSAIDATMMYPESFNVLILPLGESDARLSEYRLRHIPTMWDKLTLILQSDSLLPLVHLIQSARTQNTSR